jgi:hypothetical protein
MKPNTEICRACACSAVKTTGRYTPKGSHSHPNLPIERAREYFDTHVKNYGYILWCKAVGENLCLACRDFDEDDELAPDSDQCPFFLEHVISQE